MSMCYQGYKQNHLLIDQETSWCSLLCTLLQYNSQGFAWKTSKCDVINKVAKAGIAVAPVGYSRLSCGFDGGIQSFLL